MKTNTPPKVRSCFLKPRRAKGLNRSSGLSRQASLATMFHDVSFDVHSNAPLSSPIPRRASKSQLLGSEPYYQEQQSNMQGPFPSPPITPTSTHGQAPSPPVSRRRSVRFEDQPSQSAPADDRSARASSVPISQPRVAHKAISTEVLSFSHPPLASERQRKRSQSQLSQPELQEPKIDALKRPYRAFLVLQSFERQSFDTLRTGSFFPHRVDSPMPQGMLSH
jgi:hypothetical protein